MRTLAIALTLLLAIPASAAMAQSASDTQWAHLQQLKPGTTLHVKTAQSSTKCSFQSASPSALVCAHGTEITIPRADIRRISISHRGRSTLIGFLAGAGIGAISGAAAIHPDSIITRGDGAAFFGAGAAVLGAAIGVATDFTHSTIYRGH